MASRGNVQSKFDCIAHRLKQIRAGMEFKKTDLLWIGVIFGADRHVLGAVKYSS